MQLTLLALAVLFSWWLLVRRAVPRGLALLVLLTCPFVTVPAAAVIATGVDYFYGLARWPMTLSGYPGPEALNLNQTYRLFPAYTACSQPCLGPALLVGERQGALRVLLTAFGPPKNTYVGPYPARREALSWLEQHGVRVHAGDWQRREISGLGGPIRLAESAAERVQVPSGQGVRAALWRGTCLLVEVKAAARHEVHLIDLGGLGWFAKYRVGSNEDR